MRRIEDVGAGARRMGAGRRDVADDRDRRGKHVGDDLAHTGDEAAGRVEAQDNDFGVALGCGHQRLLHVPGYRGTDRAIDPDLKRKLGRTRLLRREGRR